MKKHKLVGIGSGYFAGFQYRAWTNRIPEVEVTAMCNRNIEKARPMMEEFNIPRHYTNYIDMLNEEKPDIVDIIAPPDTHLEMCKAAADRGIDIICQKPLAPTLEEAREIVEYVDRKNVRFMVHENWRFQPWYREMKELIKKGVIGDVHSMYFRSRMGDGWGENAYIPRQPYFRTYPRFLVYENAIHFIDTFRFLFGEVKEVYATLRKLNKVIKGEDSAKIFFRFKNGVEAIWDANRYNEPTVDNPRLTFGNCLMEGSKGSVRFYEDARITIQKLGEREEEYHYEYSDIDFSADCVYTTQRHFIDCLNTGDEFETNGHDYLKSLAVQEPVYKSAEIKKPVIISV